MKNDKTLNSGQKIPAIGFGTWKLEQGEQATESVTTALLKGYRLLDTASIYGNEQSVGEAIKLSEVPRNEIFVTTKLWKSDMGTDDVKKAFLKSLKLLDLDYIDLFLIHWPHGNKWQETWKAMEALCDGEQLKNIGVSNFKLDDLQKLMNLKTITPAVNQIEIHPFNYHTMKPTIEFCQSNGILVEAYSPLSQGAWLDNSTIADIAKKYQKQSAQILLRWSVQHDFVPLPKATTPKHMFSNLDIFDFELSSKDMDTIDQIGGNKSVLTVRRQAGWYLKNVIGKKSKD